MIELTPDQIMGLFLAIIGIFPSILLFRMYMETKITDYLLFGLFFLDGIAVLILDPIAGIMHQLIFYQAHHICIDIAFLILFIHACRMSWKKIPNVILALGIGYFLVLFIMTLMWQIFPQKPYDTVIFFYLPHSYSSYYPNGAGLRINNVLIYSTAYRYIGEFYRFFSLGFLFYAYYFKTRPIVREEDQKIKKARKIWLLIWGLFLLHTISLFPWFTFSFVGISLVIAAILFLYISFFLPEGLLISNAQLTRILPLYDFIIKKSDENPTNTTVDSIKNYLSILSKIDDDGLD